MSLIGLVLAPALGFPLACEIGKTCEVQNYVDRIEGPGVGDYRCGSETYEAHNGVDIRLPDMAAQRRGVDVLAPAAGRVSRVRDGVADVSVRVRGQAAVAGQECGNGIVIDHGEGWESQACHLAQGSVKVRIGETVRAGQPMARVGLSGNTEYPHLHLTIRHLGRVVDPFRPDGGGCEAVGGPGTGSLWTARAAVMMSYKPAAVLNAGFSGQTLTLDGVDDPGPVPAGKTAPALLAYVRAINLKVGDQQRLVVTGPDGKVLAEARPAIQTRNQAQYLVYAGRKTPAGGWPGGIYHAQYRLVRDGAGVIERGFEVRIP